MTRRLLVFGASGQLGTALQQTMPASWAVVPHDLPETDIRDERAVAAAIDSARPDAIINCAAFTNVDAAESQTEAAGEVNAANEASRCGIVSD